MLHICWAWICPCQRARALGSTLNGYIYSYMYKVRDYCHQVPTNVKGF